MTMTITDYSSLINIEFPIAGADNDTQVFRDNFSNIQLAFNTTSDEVVALQQQLNATITSDFATSVANTVTNNVLDKITTSTVTYVAGKPANSTGSWADRKGMIYATTGAVYICTANWVAPGDANIWAKITTDWPW